MKMTIKFIWFCLAGFVITACSVKPAPESTDLTLHGLSANFKNPGAEWRAKPFWSWNGDLEKDELIRQIEVFREMGMGGFFMHSRVGLQTEYLGDKWFDLINACADTAEKLGMEAWLYDEDRWPSGIAGGLVTKNKEFRMQFLTGIQMPAENFSWSDSTLAAFVCTVDTISFSNARRIKKDSDMKSFAGQKILAFVRTYDKPNDFYNGYTYANTMDRKATDEYIRLTHEKYTEKCGDRLGTSIKGIFTDEPHRGAVFGNPASWDVPWTYDFQDKFQAKYGYDILNRLPELYLRKDGERVNQVKWHYMELAQELFIENWEKPYANWCKKNNMIFTGHVLHEDNLMAQSIMQGSLMRFYEFQDYPGVDVLTEGNNNYWIVKQVSSAARQMNQKFILSELYGCSGWQMNFESHKATGNWQALFGVNLRCPHLSWYTMQGEAKRDYPASISFQSGWYKDYNYVENYFSRLGMMLSQGKPVCDLLVVNPIESDWSQANVGWANNLSGNTKDILLTDKNYSSLFCWLQNARIDFDYGDEEMMSRLSHFGKTDDGKALFYVGSASYKAILVGNMTTIRNSTLELLDQFVRAGGKVIFAGDPPAFVDALKSEKAAELASHSIKIPYEKAAIVNEAGKYVEPSVQVIDRVTGKGIDSVYCQVRKDTYRKYVVLMNMNRVNGYSDVLIRIPGQGLVTEWNCTSGEPIKVKANPKDGFVEITADIPPSGEHVFTVSDEPQNDMKEEVKYVVSKKTDIKGPFNYSLNEKNVCVLDMGSYSVSGEKFSSPTEILKIDIAVRNRFGLKLRGGSMLQPWFSAKYEKKPEVKGRVAISFPFQIEVLPSDSVFLCMETPEAFSVTVNGIQVQYKNKGWWIDPCIKKIYIPVNVLKKGKNEVLLNMDFSSDKNLEALFLTGNFGVKLNGISRIITKLPEKLNTGDIVSQYLPFYSGAITYHIPVMDEWKGLKNIFLGVPGFEAACIKVSGVGSPVKMIAWQPYQADISDIVSSAKEILVEVVLTRRNTFGPLHQLPLRPWAYGPFSFVPEGKSYSENYTLIPSGLLADPVINFCNVNEKQTSSNN
jgi:hypothetical protein